MIKDILDGVTPAGKVANALTLNINGEQTEYDGSAAKSVTIQSGESALTYGDSIAATNAPVVSNGINLEESNFNRTPVANDTFIAVVTYGGNTYLCNFTVMSVIDHVQCRYDSVQQVSGNNRVQRSYNIVFNGFMNTGKIIATCQLNYSEDVTMSVVAQFTDVLKELGFTADSDVSNNNMFPASGYFKPHSGNAIPVVGFVVRSNLYACAINTETMEIQQIMITTTMPIGVTVV